MTQKPLIAVFVSCADAVLQFEVDRSSWGSVFLGVAPRHASAWNGYGFLSYRACQAYGSEIIYGAYYALWCERVQGAMRLKLGAPPCCIESRSTRNRAASPRTCHSRSATDIWEREREGIGGICGRLDKRSGRGMERVFQ